MALSWQAPAEDAGSVTGYEILRSRGKGELTILVADTGNAATAHTDATAGGDSESYAYRVRAIRGGERSADSNEARVKLPPAAPRWAPGTASHDTVTLLWAGPQDDSITGYRILRRESTANGPGQFVAIVEDTVSRDTAYSDDTVEPERFYVYRVHAISPQGVSGPSPDLPVDTDAAPVVATQESMPADPKSPSSLAAGLTGGRVVLTWDAPAEDAGSVTGYEILRAEGPRRTGRPGGRHGKYRHGITPIRRRPPPATPTGSRPSGTGNGAGLPTRRGSNWGPPGPGACPPWRPATG